MIAEGKLNENSLIVSAQNYHITATHISLVKAKHMVALKWTTKHVPTETPNTLNRKTAFHSDNSVLETICTRKDFNYEEEMTMA